MLAVAAVTLTVNLTVAVFWLTTLGRGILPYEVDGAGNVLLAAARVPPAVFLWSTVITLAVIAGRSLVTMSAMRAGGDAVARMVGGVPLERGTADPAERRLLNVVDEMAIASGVTVPRVYVLRGEPGLNAFAAGYVPNQAAIAVTEGALRQLTRDELQGVIGHEFSHVLNGDMRLNVRMIAVLAGILFIGEIGEFLMRSAAGGRRSRRGNRSAVILLGFALTVIGYVGLFFGRLVRAAVSRQRELLGDASAVQFTRNPRGLAGALAVIGAAPDGSLIRSRHAETLSHMFFADGITVWLGAVLATHPPVMERIRRIAPGFVPAEYLQARTAAPPAAGVPEAPAAAPVMPAVAPRTSRPAAALVASVGRPTPAHVDYATELLAALPPALRAAADDPAAAPALVLAFALATDAADRKPQLRLLELDGQDALALRADALAGPVRTLPPVLRLPVVAIALATVRGLEATVRDGLVRGLQAVVEADQHVTLEEFVLLTIVRQQLVSPPSGLEPVKYRSILEVIGDARLVLSLLAHAGTTDGSGARAAFERGTTTLGLSAAALTPPGEIDLPRVGDSFGRLRRLAPFVKRLFLEACVEAVSADGSLSLREAELLRAIAAALDCPVPPVLGAPRG